MVTFSSKAAEIEQVGNNLVWKGSAAGFFSASVKLKVNDMLYFTLFERERKD